MNRQVIKIEAKIEADITKVWEYWTSPVHIINWNAASEDWHTTKSENDLRVGGKFTSRMEAKDGSFGFDFWGIYDEIIINKKINYTLGDGRIVKIDFGKENNFTTVVTNFEAETENTVELQEAGWQAILNNFKKYTELN